MNKNEKKATVSTKQLLLVSAFAAIIVLPVLVQTGVELDRGRRPQVLDLFVHVPAESRLRDFEEELEDESWLREKIRPWMQYTRFMALGEVGKNALRGRHGWLFYEQGIRYAVEPWPPEQRLSELTSLGGPAAVQKQKEVYQDPVPVIRRFRDQLEARGIKLLVVIAPDKVSVYPGKFTTRADRSLLPLDTHTTGLVERISQSGMEVLDLTHTLVEARRNTGDTTEYYMHEDTHWTPEGLQLAAQTVADRVLELGWAGKGSVEYGLKEVEVSRQGDIVWMSRAPQIQEYYGHEEVTCRQVVRRDNGALYRDDPHSDILLLGDSFSRIFQTDDPTGAGFIAHLAHQFRKPLTSVVNNGGGATLVRQQLSYKPRLLRNKKLVIWEFVERDFRFAAGGWKHVELPPPEDYEDRQPTKPESKKRRRIWELY